MRIHHASIARPRLGQAPSVRVPRHVQEAAEAYRSGRVTLAEARRRIAGLKRGRPVAVPTSDRRRRAVEGARKRLATFDKSRNG